MNFHVTGRSANINVMVKAAEKAAKSLLHDFNEVENLQVSVKSLGDFVSTADTRAERIIRSELEKARPSYGFLMEEGGEIEGKDSRFRWIIDPLDGTTNFLHGVPHFCISIALECDKEIICGVIYDPVKNELFWAERGAGAFLNQTRIRVSKRKNLNESLLATGIPFGEGAKKNLSLLLKQLDHIMPFVSGVRRMGSAALDLAYVAAGRVDAYFETGISYWDIAAGIILVKEAGGYVTEIKGGDKVVENKNILASNEVLYSTLVKAL